MKIKYRGGQMAIKGTYWSPTDGRRVDMDIKGVLPGDEEITYLRVKIVWLLLLAPLAGGLFVIAFPMIGVATVIGMYVVPVLGMGLVAAITGGKLFGKLYEMVGRSISFGWRPANSYLAGRMRKSRGEKKPEKGK